MQMIPTYLTVFHDNPYAGPSTSLLSDEEEDVTTSPSLTFGKKLLFSGKARDIFFRQSRLVQFYQ
jgi:hypothetical protein